MAYIGVSPSNGVRRKHTYTATAAQTSFSGAGAEGITLGYLDSNYVDVYQNGVKLSEADYTSTSGTAIVLAQGASVSDIVEVVVYDVFSVADTVSKSAGGTFDGAITANAGVVVDNITIDGTEIDLSSGDLTIDVAGTISLDTDSGGIYFKDGGTTIGEFINSSSDFMLKSAVQDKDILLKGNDGGATITALKLDMSEDGHATFKNGVTLTDGNLVVASGHGIDFSATSDATGMGGELLDDYEDGVYTPTVTGATSGSYTVGDSATKLAYTKIGRMVHLQGQIHITGKSSPSGVVNVSLPFASGNTTDLAERSAGSVIFDSANSSNGVAHNSGNFVNFMVSTSSSVGIFRSSEENTSAGSLNQSHLDTNDRFTIGITYITF